VRPAVTGSPVGADGRLDDAALGSLRELGGDDFLAEVIDTFLADVPALLATAHRAVDEADAGEVRRAAHTLKSNAATLGATDLAELCRELEQHAKDGRLTDGSALLARIEEEYRLVEPALGGLRPRAAT
jgi:HPt (histidine-containing phosphotransfer) domain-containing protein